MKDVELKNQKTGKVTPYPLEVAESILKLEAKIKAGENGHALNDKKLTFENGKIIKRSGGKTDKGAETVSGATEGETKES